MDETILKLLQCSAATENVSVEHYPDGNKRYTFPVLAMLFIDSFEQTQDMFGTLDCHIGCSYTMSTGFPTLHCTITLVKQDKTVFDELEDIYMPLNPKKQKLHQQHICKLIDTCSQRVVEQEVNKEKIALAAVAHSTLHNNLYN